MSKIEITVDDDNIKMWIFDDNGSTWLNYHVTKHLIDNFEKEGFSKIFDIDNTKIREIRAKQLNQFNCKVNQFNTAKNTCRKCDFVQECRSLIDDESLSKMYTSLIIKGIEQDHKNSTHAHYEQKKTQFSQKLSEKILFIDDNGFSIICRKKSKNFGVFTCYGRTSFTNTTDMQLSLKKILNEPEWLRLMNIKRWNAIFNRKEHHNVIKHLPENW